MGTQAGAELVRLSGAGVFEFTYECGKIAGPAIAFTIPSFIGIPEIAAVRVGRLASRLRPLFAAVPAPDAFAERAARRLGRGPASPDIDEPAPRRPGGYTAAGRR